MNREQIIRMAREAGLDDEVLVPWAFEIECFAAFIAAAEREACAKVCEAQGSRHDYLHKNWGDNCASLIRARGETK